MFMQAIILQIVGLLIIVTLIILFFSKPNVDNVETKTYSKLIGLNFLFIVIGILTYIIAKLTGNLTFIGILQKIYIQTTSRRTCKKRTFKRIKGEENGICKN